MSRQIVVIILVGVIVLILALFIMFRSVPTQNTTVTDQTQNATSTTAPINTTPQPIPDNLKIEDLTVGTGQEVKPGDTVTMNYVGTLEDGTKFDSSDDRNQPFTTQIGTGQVIKGWDLGIPGMKVGGKRRLTIPPELGYGAEGAGDKIPGNSTLIFEVELLSIQK